MSNSNHIWKEVVPLPGPHYERCSLVPIKGKGELPDFLFRINTEHGQGGPLLLSVELFLRPDSGLWRFANNHPQWKKDVRPLLLMLVQDIFWKFKILDCGKEPLKIRGRNADPKHQGGLDFELVARRFCEGDDATLVSLANYTNTHVIDQLQAVYAQNPSVRWTEERAAEIKAKFYEDFAEKKQRSELQRKERLSRWTRSAQKQIYFIDESGDLGFRDLNAHFLYTACGTEFSASMSMGAALQEILDSEWGRTKPNELHFNKIPESKRARIFTRVADCFEFHGGTAICYAMPKRELLKYFLRCEAETRRLEEQPIITNLFDLFSRRENHPGSYFLSLCAQEMSVFLGTQCVLRGQDFEIVHDRKHWGWMNEALTKGFERAKDDLNAISLDIFGASVEVNSSFRLEDSKDQPCLWISDWIGWEVGRWLRGEELSEAMKRALQAIRIITFDGYGQKVECGGLGGKVISEFPDWPRRWVPGNAN
jgi:hypothetical protein